MVRAYEGYQMCVGPRQGASAAGPVSGVMNGWQFGPYDPADSMVTRGIGRGGGHIVNFTARSIGESQRRP